MFFYKIKPRLVTNVGRGEMKSLWTSKEKNESPELKEKSENLGWNWKENLQTY